jgi:hypothetical protein
MSNRFTLLVWLPVTAVRRGKVQGKKVKGAKVGKWEG